MSNTDLLTILIIAGEVIFYLGYGLVMAILWIAPGMLIGATVLLGAMYVRKLVLDAVREAKK